MSVDANKAVVRRYDEGDHDGRDNTELWDQLCTPDMTLYASVFPEPVRGLGPLKQMTRAMHDAMSGFAIMVDELIGEHDRVAARWTMSGTHTGPFPLPGGASVPGSGKSFSVGGISICRLEGGRIAEERTEVDWVGMMGQLGITPAG
jgi:predicted ester cyclase